MSRALSRRQFLRRSAGLGLVRASGFGLQRFPPVHPVVVVGAGLAGLHAATLLERAGVPILVLEARRVSGGRVRTVRAGFDEGLYGEAGAIRIAPQHARVQQLARAHELSLVPFISTNGAAVIHAAGRTVRTPEDVGALADRLALRPEERNLSQGALLQRYAGDAVAAFAAGRAPDGLRRALDATTWPAWLRAQGASDGAVTLMTLGGDSRDLSALYVLQQIAPLSTTTQYFKIHGGMDLLPRAMAAPLGARIRYGAVVTAIANRGDDTAVTFVEAGRARTVQASHVVLTVPASTMDRIAIAPPLPPAIAEAVRHTTYFPAVRCLLQVRERFWHEQDLNASARTDHPAELWDCSYDLPADRGLIGMTVGGAFGHALSIASRAEGIRRAVRVAARTFPAFSSYYDKGMLYRWEVDPWARGAFAVFRPGSGSITMPSVYQPVGRLHFAGEHASSQTGWMEGALESGERAAHEVLATSAAERSTRG